MRPSRSLMLLSLAALLATGVAQAGDEVDSTRYTGFAFTYEFGGDVPAPAGLSFGALDLTRPGTSDPTVVHIPLVSVLLANHGEPEMAAVQLLGGVVSMFQAESASMEQYQP